MCRFVFYSGAPIPLSSLITDPANSLIHQSFDALERAEPLNGDGFGVAWYPLDGDGDAALFRSITPAWNNQNLRHLARAIRTGCMLAHVRAASTGLAVSEANTHPFVAGSYAFMHNGVIAEFRRHRRGLMNLLDEHRYAAIEGTTDSECLFAHVLQRLDGTPNPSADELASALEGAIATVVGYVASHGTSSASLINAVLSSGRATVACRFTSRPDEPAASLHLHTGRMYTCRSGEPELVRADVDSRSIIVASETLTHEGEWSTVPSGSIVIIDERPEVTVRPLDL